MKPTVRRILLACSVLVVAALASLGIVLARGSAAPGVSVVNGSLAEPSLLSAAQMETHQFLHQGSAVSATGGERGLFETDFFKPVPPPPPKPKPPPPASREIPLVYRGLAAFPDSGGVAYLAVENRVLLLSIGDVVTDGWTLTSFDAIQAVMSKGEETRVLPFNVRSPLTVPIAAKP